MSNTGTGLQKPLVLALWMTCLLWPDTAWAAVVITIDPSSLLAFCYSVNT